MMLYRCCLAFLLLLVAVVLVVDATENDSRINGVNGWYVPKLDDSFEWVDRKTFDLKFDEMENFENERGLSTTPVKYYLYTNKNPTKKQKITPTRKSIDKSNFDANNPTRFILHGWIQNKASGMNKAIRKAWLAQGDFNIIVIDWMRARSVDYASSVLAVPKVGKKFAKMIDFLVTDYGMSLETLHVIGHSLGAHVAGYAGKNIKTGQIHTIVGLDPALPLFSYDKPNKRLSKTDAFYVESIQTCGGLLGFLEPIGKSAFYPNGGKTQPGCPIVDVVGVCSHERSTTYYAEAIAKNSFPSIKCENYEMAVNKDCGNSYSSVRMAATTNSYAVSGDFYVPVNKKAPYGIGAV